MHAPKWVRVALLTQEDIQVKVRKATASGRREGARIYGCCDTKKNRQERRGGEEKIQN